MKRKENDSDRYHNGRGFVPPLVESTDGRHLRDAHKKLDGLISVRIEHPSAANHYLRETIYRLQTSRNGASLDGKLQVPFPAYGRLDASCILNIVSMVFPPSEPDMNPGGSQGYAEKYDYIL